MNIDISLGLFLLFLALGLSGLIVFWFYRRRQSWESLSLKILQIRIPRASDDKNDPLKEINLTEQLFSALSSIDKSFGFELAVKNTGEEIGFFLAVPRSHLDFAKRTIQGLFLEARVDEVPDYTIFQPYGVAVAGYLQTDKNYILPITTYQEAGADVFGPILSSLSRLREVDEGAALQLIVKPIDKKIKKELTYTLEQLKKGVKFSEAIPKNVSGKELYQILFGKSSTTSSGEIKEKTLDEDMIKAISLKLAKPLFSVNVRVVSSSSSLSRAEDVFLALSNTLTKFSSPVRNSFKVIKPRKNTKLIFDYVFRHFNKKQSLVLNVEEMASIFHLPNATSDIPNVSWLRSKDAPPPERIPKEGLSLGQSTFRGASREIKITPDDRRRHLYIVGQTGTGKSTLINNLVIQDMELGNGLCLVDPHGELVDKVLTFVPEHRLDDIIIFDPADRDRPLGLNMLEYDVTHPEEKTFIINEFLAIFNQLFDKAALGPMFERYMRGALNLLMDDMVNEPATIVDLPRVFTDEAFRARKLARSKNSQVIDFWTKEATKASGEQSLANFAPYISSKFDGFISNDYIRPIIGQTKSSFDFRSAMDEGKIILVNLSKGRIGDISSSLLGMVIVGKILKAALSRADSDEKSRRDFYLYIDEFQNYTTESIATILSEARKYRLNLVVAHQFIAQLKDNIREAVFGNVGNLITFRVGVQDAEFLVKHFSPVFNEKDLISIENLNAYAKILVAGEPSNPFNMNIKWAVGGAEAIKDGLKELSRLRYGQNLAQIEDEIDKRLRI